MKASNSPCNGIVLYILVNALGVYAPDTEPKLRVEPRNQDIVMPISPYFTDHIKQEEVVLRSIGIDFDTLHDAVTTNCPIGSPDDPPEIYNNSMSYLGDIIKAGQVKFRQALEIMARDTPEGKAELAKFSFDNLETAATIFQHMETTIAGMPSFAEAFRPIEQMILQQVGWRYPAGTPRATNLQHLAYDIYSAQVDLEQDLVKIPADRKHEFLLKWGGAHDKIARYATWAKNMRSWAYTYLNSDGSNELLDGWKDPGRIGVGNTHVQSQVSYALVFLRYFNWATCWQNPIMRIVGWTINTMGPLPYPGVPTFYQKTTMTEADMKEEMKKADENRKALEKQAADLEAEHARLLAEKAKMLEMIKERDNLAAEAKRLRDALAAQARQETAINPVNNPRPPEGAYPGSLRKYGRKMKKKLIPPQAQPTNNDNNQNTQLQTPRNWSWWKSLLKSKGPNQDNPPQDPPQ
ncbi:hypothetical protein AA313_de0207247 [Arthrobotrys entomopaga]|nr:hypothetical protein AA313_de0207247 [Arthrobotrys entomopaga]